MTTFDEREHAFEAKLAHDEELKFKARARRDKRLGLWAAGQLGKTGVAAEDFASRLV
ncbi:MAG: ATPase inhibitor subunit zeta, partial [Methylocella sp.]